jgi:hypothetical protein
MPRDSKGRQVRMAEYTALGWQVPDIAAGVEELEKADM